MAIDVLKRQGKSAVTGILGKNARRISRNIGSVIRGDIDGGSSQIAPINRKHQATKMLSYPIDVGADPGIGNHGHYIMFFINENTKAELNFGGGFADVANAQDMGLENIVGTAAKRRLKATGKHFDSIKSSFLDRFNPNQIANQLFDGLDDIIGGFGIGTKGRIKTEKKHQIRAQEDQTVAFKRAPTKRLETAIAMYMPPNIKTSYKADYQDTSMMAFTSDAIKAATEFMKTGKVKGKVQENLENALGVGAESTVKELTRAVGGGIVEQIEMQEGVILADRMELAFKGIDKRTFEYEFKMMPRSKEEADQVAEIIFAFKYHMLPELAGGDKTGRRLTVPSTFDIQYMYVNQENNYLHKISTCYLEGMDVTYGGTKYTTFDGNEDGAPPIETTITLTFREIELITRERVEEGF